MKSKKVFNALDSIIGILAVLSIVAAIWDQLRRPREERTWYGSVFGIPYDFRLPSLQRIKDTFWNGNDSRIFVPRAFGVGWDMNFYPILHPGTAQQ